MITLPDADGLTVMLLATHRCQLACGYCEMPFAEQDMPRELVARVVLDLDHRLSTGCPLTLVWHGGEPLLRGVAFYRWVHGLLAPVRARRPVRNVLQTNGLLLDSDFLDLLGESGDFLPILSMDGPEAVTGATRGVGVEPYQRLFAELRRRGLDFGVSVVGSPVLRENLEEALVWFAAHGLEQVGLTPYQTCAGSHRATPDLFADLALDARGGPTLLGRNVLQGILDQRLRGVCRFSSFSASCHRQVLCVDAEGGLSTCLRGKWSGLWTWGNAHSGGLDVWWTARDGPPPFRPSLPEACEACTWERQCQGGCPSNARAMNGGADQPDFYCASFKRLFLAAERLVLEEAVAQVEARRAAPH